MYYDNIGNKSNNEKMREEYSRDCDRLNIFIIMRACIPLSETRINLVMSVACSTYAYKLSYFYACSLFKPGRYQHESCFSQEDKKILDQLCSPD